MRHAFNPPGTDMQVVQDQAHRRCFDTFGTGPESTLIHDHKEADSCDQRAHMYYRKGTGLVSLSTAQDIDEVGRLVMKYNKERIWPSSSE